MRHLCLRLNVVVIAVKWLGQAEETGRSELQEDRSLPGSNWLKMEPACYSVRKTFLKHFILSQMTCGNT